MERQTGMICVEMIAMIRRYYLPEFWISSCRVRNAPNDVWDDNFTHFDLGLRENVSRYAR